MFISFFISSRYSLTCLALRLIDVLTFCKFPSVSIVEGISITPFLYNLSTCSIKLLLRLTFSILIEPSSFLFKATLSMNFEIKACFSSFDFIVQRLSITSLYILPSISVSFSISLWAIRWAGL